MAQFVEVIKGMNVAERMQALEYLCTVLSPNFAEHSPDWHLAALQKTEELVAAGEDEFMSLDESKRRFAEMTHAC